MTQSWIITSFHKYKLLQDIIPNPTLYKWFSQKMRLLINWQHHLPALVRVLSFKTSSEFEVNEGKGRGSEQTGEALVVANSSFAGVCTGWRGFGVYVKLRSLFSDKAMSSFSSNPLVGSKLHLSGVCLANASLNFLICHYIKLY